MAMLESNKFTSYLLTYEEEREGHKFTITQKQVLHNHMVSWAKQQLEIVIDPANPMKNALELQYLKGAQEAIEYILIRCAAIEESDKSEAIHHINTQPN